MSPSTLCFFTFVSALVAVQASTSAILNKPDCHEFSKGVNFNESEAIGVWHLLHYRTEKSRGLGETQCIEFSAITDQVRKELSERLSKRVNGLKWEALTLKMQIPCTAAQTNRTAQYYLEKIELNGSYRTLQPQVITENELSNQHHLYPMRLKMIDNKHLGMMDCNEKFVFIMGRDPQDQGKPLDEKIKKVFETYWPEDFN